MSTDMKKTDKKVVCVAAATRFYTVGQVYDVYQDHTKLSHVQGSDGFFDPIHKASSQFKEYKETGKEPLPRHMSLAIVDAD